MVAAVRAELRRFLSQLDLELAVIFVAAGLALCVYHYFGGNEFYDAYVGKALHLRGDDLEFVRCLWWCFTPFLSLVVLPQLALRTFWLFRSPAVRPRFGWGAGDWKLGVGFCAVFYAVVLVLVAWVSHTNDFRGVYPLCGAARHSLAKMALYEVAFALYFVAWESFFRGFLTFGLERAFGFNAIFVQMLPFVVVHFDKPVLEAMSSVFGGIALGYLALRTRSFWYGAFIHAAMAITLDIFVMSSTGFH